MNKPLIQVRELSKHFPIRQGVFSRKVGAIQAVSDLSLNIYEGEIFALMGESGCGKTTCGLTILRLLEKTSGKVQLNGQDLYALPNNELRRMRSNFQVLFQNPQEALDPLMTVYKLIEEPLLIHQNNINGKNRREIVEDTSRRVGLQIEHLKRYPRELSGGEQQRVCISRALVLKPKFLMLDEPTSALDVSVQARVLDLLLHLREEFNLTYLLISHDAAVVRFIADRVGIMYLGRLVEVGPTESVFANPHHPYTKALIHSVLSTKSRIENIDVLLHGTPPSPKEEQTGCVFMDRCQEYNADCLKGAPVLELVGTDHSAACWHSPLTNC
ncbi:MAG: ABC transporter ATP-binding protein [bacterium]|nr:ABC transporter ATP-binding protein [bacterium]